MKRELNRRETTEEAILATLLKQALEGNSNAASVLGNLMERVRLLVATRDHDDRMASLAPDGVELAEYFATLGMSLDELEEHINKKPTKEQCIAWERGRKNRKLEVRALELAAARAGKEIPGWMRR